MPKFTDLRISLKLGLLVVIFLAGFLVFAFFAANGLSQVQVNGPIYSNIVRGKDLIADILPPPEYIIETHLTNLQMLISLENGTQAADLPGLIQKINSLHNDFNTRHDYWNQNLADGAVKSQIMVLAYQPADKYFTAVETKFIPALQAGDLSGATKILNETLIPLYQEHRQAIDQVNVLASQENSTLEADTASQVQQLWLLLGIVGVISAGASVIFSILISRGIARPIAAMVVISQHIAEGDVAQKIELRSNDEIGQLAEAFRKMIQYLEKMAVVAKKMASNNLSEDVVPVSERDVLGVAFHEMTQNLNSMVCQVQDGVHTLAGASAGLSGKANSVASAAKEMSLNTVSVAAGMEEAATNLRSVATATEEMTATISEIAANSEKARQITGNAVHQADQISETMHNLGQSANEIGKISETIKSISNQTNLLALNATIEAARAGANGRGFSVVATEIKELATQASVATEDIKQKVSAVQKSIQHAIKDNEEIRDVFAQVSNIVTTIATAIEEQSVVTKDIASNIAQASQGVSDSNERVGQTSLIVQNVERDISGESSGHNQGYEEKAVITSVLELSQLAEQLRILVAKFQV